MSVTPSTMPAPPAWETCISPLRGPAQSVESRRQELKPRYSWLNCMQIYAPVGREVGNLQKQEAAHQRPRIPAWAQRISGGHQKGKGLVWFNEKALLSGGTLGPGNTGSQSGQLLSPQHKEDKRRSCIAAFVILCQFIAKGNSLYIFNKTGKVILLHLYRMCDNTAGEMA